MILVFVSTENYRFWASLVFTNAGWTITIHKFTSYTSERMNNGATLNCVFTSISILRYAGIDFGWFSMFVVPSGSTGKSSKPSIPTFSWFQLHTIGCEKIREELLKLSELVNEMLNIFQTKRSASSFSIGIPELLSIYLCKYQPP